MLALTNTIQIDWIFETDCTQMNLSTEFSSDKSLEKTSVVVFPSAFYQVREFFLSFTPCMLSFCKNVNAPLIYQCSYMSWSVVCLWCL